MVKIILLTLFSIQVCFSQIILEGTVIDQALKSPIAYANIGIVNTGVGTISNEDGSFALRISTTHVKDTVLFSAVGYSRQKISVQSMLDKSTTAQLKEEVIQLKEVTIRAAREENRFFELGNKRFAGGTLETDTLYSGSAIALLIQNNQKQKDFSFPCYLQTAQIRIFRNNLPSFRFRVRIYAVDSATQEPGDDLLNKSVVVESTMRNGWLQFDLSEYKVRVDKPFFVAFEPILTKRDRTMISNGYQDFIKKHPNRIRVDTVMFEGKKQVRQQLGLSGLDLPGTFIAISSNESVREKNACYTRNTSFDAWEKVRGILAATVTVSSQ